MSLLIFISECKTYIANFPQITQNHASVYAVRMSAFRLFLPCIFYHIHVFVYIIQMWEKEHIINVFIYIAVVYSHTSISVLCYFSSIFQILFMQNGRHINAYDGGIIIIPIRLYAIQWYISNKIGFCGNVHFCALLKMLAQIYL